MKKILLFAALLVAFAGIGQAQNIVSTRVIGSGAYTNALVVSAKPTKLYSVTGYNSGAAQWIQVFSTNGIPANGSIPVFSVNVPAQQYFSIDFSYYGADMDSIAVANSSTGNTLTKGSADCGIQAIIRAN